MFSQAIGKPTPPAIASGGVRLAAAFISVVLLAVLALAATLHADPAGHGTHEQIGLPACGFALATGKPCPTCGMTTAFTHAAHGNYRRSLATQPGGLAASLGVAAFLWPCMHTAVTGSRALELCGKLLTPKALWIAAGIWIGSWVYTFVNWPVT
ncbi:MAG: DUF2752 domain-containing protein [Phycisphaerales bacterium]|nr:DUF2752 domain-containing protein [Phycisphaerales bacterium]